VVAAAIAELGAPQAGHAIEVAVAVVVPQVQALAAHHHLRPFGVQGLLIQERMDVVGGVGLLVVLGLALRCEGCIHGFFSLLWKSRKGGCKRGSPAERAPELWALGLEKCPHPQSPKSPVLVSGVSSPKGMCR
jgi:hypothetical protein